MTTKTNRINYKVGVWHTRATIVRHRNGDTTLTHGYEYWSNSRSTFRRKKVKFTGKYSVRLRGVFDGTELAHYYDKSYPVTLDQFLTETVGAP